MNEDTKETLARRAVASKHWRWMPGMLDTDGVRFCTLVQGRPHGAKQSGHASMVRGLPDPDDPATQGCALAIIAERNHRKSMADALRDVAYHVGRGLSFPEALVVVLEGT